MGTCGCLDNDDEKNREINTLNNNDSNNKKEVYEENKNKIDNFELNTKGFPNIGNSCYMNSFLQILFHCPHFLYELKNVFRNYTSEKYLIKNKCLIKNIIDLSIYPEKKELLYAIKNFMQNISDYGSFKENDSQEFGKYLINEILINIKGQEDNFSQIDIISNKKMSNNSEKKKRYKDFIEKYQKNEIFIENMFVVNECNIISKEKNISNIIFNTSFDIELIFPNNKNNEYDKEYSLEDLLDFKYKNISKGYTKNYKSEKVTQDVTAKLCRIPNILIISIVRAFLNKDLNKSILIIPEVLNLKNYIDNDLINIHFEKKKNNIKTKYHLFAINEKEGNTYYNGHYYCFINIKKKWYLFSDEKVEEHKVNLSSKEVVGLFYKKF